MIMPASTVTSGQAKAASSAIHSGRAAGSNSPELAKLGKAAGEFEAMLLQTLWKSMKETFSDANEKNYDPTLENFDDLGMQALSGAVGNSGALGIKSLILNHLGKAVGGGSNVKGAP